MKHESLRGVVTGCVVLGLLTLGWNGAARAQAPAGKKEGTAAAAAAPEAAAAAAETPAAKKTARRLPPYYGKVVSDQQREAIYAIQAKFKDDIARLQAQLASLASCSGSLTCSLSA